MSERHSELESRETIARDQLTKAIALKISADAAVTEAQAALQRGQQHLDSARNEADNLLHLAEQTKAKAAEAGATKLSDALRRGTKVLSFLAPEPADCSEIQRAKAKLDAVQTAFSILECEYKDAQASANAATQL